MASDEDLLVEAHIRSLVRRMFPLDTRSDEERARIDKIMDEAPVTGLMLAGTLASVLPFLVAGHKLFSPEDSAECLERKAREDITMLVNTLVVHERTRSARLCRDPEDRTRILSQPPPPLFEEPESK